MDVLTIVTLGLLGIAAASAFGNRTGVAAPLVLVVGGLVLSALPFVPEVEVEPEWILAGVLPPLLYSASASMPTVAFRRDLAVIGGLSVVLVLVSAVLLGWVFTLVIPGLDLAWGTALGAIVSPTDAVATRIVRQVGIAPRVVTILEGESLLNDASALVVLRAAIAGAAASVSLWGVAGQFLYVVAAAVVIGFVVGHLAIAVRARLADPPVNTLVSFSVPFLAAIPAEHLGSSGLVAAVTAGLAASQHAPERLSPRHRLSDTQNWRTVELVLEGGVFLVMGLQLSGIIADVEAEHAGFARAAWVAALALVLTVVIRAGVVFPLAAFSRAQGARGASMRDWLAAAEARLEALPAGGAAAPAPAAGDLVMDEPRRRPRRGDRDAWLDRPLTPERADRFRGRIRRVLGDIDYLQASPIGWREGGVVVWAGMRGAVTLAAAQTLPEDTPNRPELILIAFLVATASLLLQGLSLARVTAWLRPAPPDAARMASERADLAALLREARAGLDAGLDARPTGASTAPEVTRQEPAEGAAPERPAETIDHLLAILDRQRRALLGARDAGRFSPEVLEDALRILDADQIRLELRQETAG